MKLSRSLLNCLGCLLTLSSRLVPSLGAAYDFQLVQAPDRVALHLEANPQIWYDGLYLPSSLHFVQTSLRY